ncbi:very short patch repair endonuclease [Catellatospora sp. NPDC049111]|uniref:very short patch repair endonuclease n=1 Tax=Catellatospora sp. NPDC049111 TaxID=3155271 RepID=UPI00340BCB5D
MTAKQAPTTAGPVSKLQTSDAVRSRMSRQRSRNTAVEVILRRELHRAGLRFRIHQRPLPGVRREADVIFTRARVAVFVDGCFWHGCPEHATWPKNNEEFWRTKIEGNRTRDADTDSKLAAAGWLSVRVWEHEQVADAAARVAATVRDRQGHDRSGVRNTVAGLA